MYFTRGSWKENNNKTSVNVPALSELHLNTSNVSDFSVIM
jgi:hypothetical protein